MNELTIGKEAAVTQCTHDDLVGTAGSIVDETKHTVVLATETGEKTVLKHTATFTINDTTVVGNDIRRRPEDTYK